MVERRDGPMTRRLISLYLSLSTNFCEYLLRCVTCWSREIMVGHGSTSTDPWPIDPLRVDFAVSSLVLTEAETTETRDIKRHDRFQITELVSFVWRWTDLYLMIYSSSFSSLSSTNDLAVVTSSRHADRSCAPRFAVAKPMFSGCRSFSMVLSLPILRLQSPGGLKMQAWRARGNDPAKCELLRWPYKERRQLRTISSLVTKSDQCTFRMRLRYHTSNASIFLDGDTVIDQVSAIYRNIGRVYMNCKGVAWFTTFNKNPFDW